MYHGFRLLVEWNEVQHILALPGTDIVIFEVVWLSTVCREPRTLDNYLFFHCFSFLPNLQMPQYEIGYVTMTFFFVVQNILVDLARSFPWPETSRDDPYVHTSLLTVSDRSEGNRICNNLVMDMDHDVVILRDLEHSFAALVQLYFL